MIIYNIIIYNTKKIKKIEETSSPGGGNPLSPTPDLAGTPGVTNPEKHLCSSPCRAAAWALSWERPQRTGRGREGWEGGSVRVPVPCFQSFLLNHWGFKAQRKEIMPDYPPGSCHQTSQAGNHRFHRRQLGHEVEFSTQIISCKLCGKTNILGQIM